MIKNHCNFTNALVKSLISGVFLLNLVCRDTDLRDQVLGDLRAVLPELYSVGIEGEVNEIVIALPQPWPDTRQQLKTKHQLAP